MSKKISVSWIQGCYQGSGEDTTAYYLSQAESIEGANLIVFPELFGREYFPLTENELFYDYAIPNTSEWFEPFSVLAKNKGAAVVVPYYEKDGDAYYNSVVVFDVDGSRAGAYRKMHIPYDPGFYEKFYFAEGNLGFNPIKTAVGTLGVLICWDQWFPEAARLMVLGGADILIYPTAIGWDDTEPESVNAEQLDAWRTSMRAHSICNGIHTLAVNRIGKEGKIDFWGNSFLCKPNGQLVNTPTLNEEVCMFNITTETSDEYREVWPFFRDRRTDAYSSLLGKGGASLQSGMICKKVWN